MTDNLDEILKGHKPQIHEPPKATARQLEFIDALLDKAQWSPIELLDIVYDEFEVERENLDELTVEEASWAIERLLEIT